MKFVGPWTVYMCTVHCRKSTFAVIVHWTVTAILQNAWKHKKKKKKEQNAAWKRRLGIQTHTKYGWNTCGLKSVIKIYILVFKYWKLLFKQLY